MSSGHRRHPATVVISHGTFVDVIYPLLDVRDILSLELVCRDARISVKAWRQSRYNINKYLKRYFDDPSSFRTLQAETGSLISGVAAFQFFQDDGTYDTNSILDLYVPCVSSLRFSLWLDKHGYVFRPTSSQRSKIQSLTSNKILSPGIRGVEGGMYVDGATHTYIRSISLRTAPAAGRMRKRSFGGVEEKLEFIQSTSPAGNITPRTVRIMVADPHAPPLMCILLFHTTFMMNFITHDAAYSLFPNATFLQRECITFSEIPEKHSHLPVYAWHRRRGYKIPAFPLAMDRSKSLWKHIGSRWPGDIRSWKLSFDVLNFRDNEAREKVALHSEYLRFSGFSVYDKVTVECSEEDLEGNPDPGTYLLGYRVPTILFRVISSKLIKSKLILPNNIFGHLINFLDSQPRLEDEIWDTFGPWLSAEPMYWDNEVLNILQQEFPGE